jgi:hypothetical protein
MKVKKRFNRTSVVVDNQTLTTVRPITIQELASLNNNPKFLEALEKSRKADPELQGQETAITSIYRRATHASRHAAAESKKMSSLIGIDGHNLIY